MSVPYESMATSEIINFVGSDPSATRRERVMVERLNHLLALAEAHAPQKPSGGEDYPRNLWSK